MVKQFLILIALILTYQVSASQSKRIGLNASYNVPLGDLSWVYNSAPGIQLNYSTLIPKGRNNNIVAVGLNLGFTKFTPKEDTFYYLTEIDNVLGYGIATYSDYAFLQLSANVTYEFRILHRFYLQLGFEIGAYYTNLEYFASDEQMTVDGRIIDLQGALVPSIGFVYRVSELIGISPFLKYHVYGSTSETTADFKSFKNHYSPGLGIHFNF